MSAIYQAVVILAKEYGYYGAVTTYRAPTMASGKRAAVALNLTILMGIILPTRAPDRQLLQAIGGERSTKMGFAVAGTDIKDGDEIHQGTIVYAVDGAEQTPHMTICALCEIEPQGVALA